MQEHKLKALIDESAELCNILAQSLVTAKRNKKA